MRERGDYVNLNADTSSIPIRPFYLCKPYFCRAQSFCVFPFVVPTKEQKQRCFLGEENRKNKARVVRSRSTSNKSLVMGQSTEVLPGSLMMTFYPLGLQCLTLLMLLVPTVSWMSFNRFSYSRPAWTRKSMKMSAEDQAITELLDQAGVVPARIDLLDGQAAFCNRVYRITTCSRTNATNQPHHPTTVIAKLFSPLALERMDPRRSLGQIDAYVARNGLAPTVLARNARGILLQDCGGRVMTEHDVYDPASDQATYRCALALAQLHNLPELPADKSSADAPNMFWRACAVSMSHIANDWECTTTTSGTHWNKALLQKVLDEHQVVMKDLSTVPVGHGDFKPSNAIAADIAGRTVFIDLEMTGRHYRSFDVAKFLRTSSKEYSHERKRFFLESYAHAVDCCNVVGLEQEVDLAMPLTWLEAAIFFAAMETLDGSQAAKWNDLARDRLENYEKCPHSLVVS